MEKGFTGCIRNLEINNKVYNFDLVTGNDVIDGSDVTECSMSNQLEASCESLVCENEGSCAQRQTADGATALGTSSQLNNVSR